MGFGGVMAGDGEAEGTSLCRHDDEAIGRG